MQLTISLYISHIELILHILTCPQIELLLSSPLHPTYPPQIPITNPQLLRTVHLYPLLYVPSPSHIQQPQEEQDVKKREEKEGGSGEELV